MEHRLRRADLTAVTPKDSDERSARRRPVRDTERERLGGSERLTWDHHCQAYASR